MIFVFFIVGDRRVFVDLEGVTKEDGEFAGGVGVSVGVNS